MLYALISLHAMVISFLKNIMSASLLLAHCFKMSLFTLDCHMDGQLGIDGEHVLVPCLLEQFLELGHPDSFRDELESNIRTSLKVYILIFVLCLKRTTLSLDLGWLNNVLSMSP